MGHRRFTQAELQRLRSAFSDTPTASLAAELGRTYSSLAHLAHKLGLRKSEAFLEAMGTRFKKRQQSPTSFKPGNQPWNKGLKGSTGHHPNTRANQYSKGNLSGRAAQLAKPVGSYRINADGVLEQKIGSTPGSPHLRWKPVHRLVWERAHGPLPPGKFVVFKLGCKTTELERITLNVLELVDRAENMRRNSVHTRVPAELLPVVRLRSSLTRAINRRSSEEPGCASTPKE